MSKRLIINLGQYDSIPSVKEFYKSKNGGKESSI